MRSYGPRDRGGGLPHWGATGATCQARRACYSRLASRATSSLGAAKGQLRPPGPEGILKVHFLDVGQGDSILIQAPGHGNVLIDAGDAALSAGVVSYLKSQGIGDVKTYRTDTNGTVVIESDGERIVVRLTTTGQEPPTSQPPATVFITRSGNKYHRYECRYLGDSNTGITLGEAVARGSTPCSVCKPPQ